MFFWFYRSVGFGILNMLKKKLHQAWNELTLQLSLLRRRTNEIAVIVSLFLEQLLS